MQLQGDIVSVKTDCETEVEDILKGVGAWHTGHFLLSSGLHSDQYMQCQRVLQYPTHGLRLAEFLCDRLIADGLEPNVVVGPALGAVHWELFVAIAMERKLKELHKKDCEIRAVFAERAGDSTEFSIRRGVELNPQDKVLVVEDVTTTGGSARKVVELVKELGATPIAVGAIVDRSGGTVSFGIPFVKLITLSLKTFETKDCPMCASGSQAIKPGSSKQN